MMIHDDKECGGEQDKRGPTGIYERRYMMIHDDT